MGLTDDQVLSDAGELVTDIVTDLSALGMTAQEQMIMLADAKRVLIAAAHIIDIMVMGDTTPTMH
jgi:hypothetical protein